MSAKNVTIINENQEQIIDDLPKEEISVSENELEAKKMSDLRAKLAAKNGNNMPPKIVEKKKHSINFGIIGSGHCGSKLAESMSNLGYQAIAINTAIQDLQFINLPQENKLHLDFGLGGTSKELSLGHEAAESYRDNISSLISTKLDTADVFIFCTSAGGGSGAGSVDVIIDILATISKPIIVLCALPQTSEDSQTKSNSLITLSKLSGYVKSNKISNLLVIDNAKLEDIYKDVNPLEYYTISNAAITEPLDIFNTLSSLPSKIKALDPNEFSKLLIDGNGLSVYGSINVYNYQEDTSIASAIIDNLDTNLLAGSFDLKKAKYAGFIMVASTKVWSMISASTLNYANSILLDVCSQPKAVFRGIYTVESDDDFVKVYSFFSGLSLPDSRVEQLKLEVKEQSIKSKDKDDARNLSLKIDNGEESVSAADRVKQKIASKSSAFGKLNKSIIDRRK